MMSVILSFAAVVAAGESLLNGIFAPQIVAVPPTAAVRDLCVLDNGEIRHYGWQAINGKRHRVYLSSRDGGANWTTCLAMRNDVGAMTKSPFGGGWISFAQDPATHETILVRSQHGPGSSEAERTPMGWKWHELRQLLPLRGRRRWIAAFSDVRCEDECGYRAAIALSDDDGCTWRRIQLQPVRDVTRFSCGDRRPHWYCAGCEPTVAELSDGTLLMALRTSGPHAAFCRSADGGETWSEPRPDPSFWQANTMPYLLRLRDGRLLFVWNNTQMLPTRPVEEYPELDGPTRKGLLETAFTNRDALHAAISEDDGRTWYGFREIILNPVRNAADFRELGNDSAQEHDKSVQQTQAVELPNGKILLALGQNAVSRRLVLFDPEWLAEKTRFDDFRNGLENLSTHLYIKSLSGGWRGWAGHCAWNRVTGAVMMRDEETERNTIRESLRLCRISDPRLVSDRQGIVWNFPALRNGRVELTCRIDGEGFRFALSDHWINPCDETNQPLSPVVFIVSREMLGADGWHCLCCRWDTDRGVAELLCDGRKLKRMSMMSVPCFGLSYLHLQTLAEGMDAKGARFRSFGTQEEK